MVWENNDFVFDMSPHTKVCSGSEWWTIHYTDTLNLVLVIEVLMSHE